MQAQAAPHVEITENGRSGSVRYREGADALSFYWEFGGGDVVAIIQVNDAAWRGQPAWLTGRQAEVLRFVAGEVIRQKAPGCRAEINEAKGEILLHGQRAAPTPAQKRMEATAWVQRYSTLKMKLGLVVLFASCIAFAFFWIKNKVFVIDPGKGSPIGESVRTDRHIATMITTLEPYTPSLNRDHSKDRYALSVLLVPLDGSTPQHVPLIGEQDGGIARLARILGSDGHTLWLVADALFGVDLASYEAVTTDDLRKANASTEPSWWEDTRRMDISGGRLQILSSDHREALSVDPATRRATRTEPINVNRPLHSPGIHHFIAAGFYTSPDTWLALLSPKEMEAEFAPKRWVRPVESADEAKVMRRFYRGTLDPISDNESHRILAMGPIGDTVLLNAAFLRMDDKSEPLRLSDPPGALMMHTSEPGLKGTLVIARVDTAGAIVWKVDTGIDRFNLQQILPGENAMAFIGPRPQIPDKVSEPLLVIIENSTGKVTSHSLWR